MTVPATLEDYFHVFRRNVVGERQVFDTPFGEKNVVYADWTASGRAYRPIESYIQREILPFVGNTHTGSTVTGRRMSGAYEEAKVVIKRHVNAGADDALVFCGSGTTGAVNKLQRILGLRLPERLKDYMSADIRWDESEPPIVFVTHMEHHSNYLSWLETIASVEVIGSDERGNVDLVDFQRLLEKFKHRKYKIAAVTACSNVTGIRTPYSGIARMIHDYNGWCFVDFACSAPYEDMDMHPPDKRAFLDAIYFSPHKFLGGPGSPGVLIFNNQLYTNAIPDQPGGGTVLYTNPWKAREYVGSIEHREDGGTPPFLQGIKAAMAIRLKESMGVENMRAREAELLDRVFQRLSTMDNVEVLEERIRERLGVVSFIVRGAHHHLIVKMLNDRFGIQTRGGCSCAGSYGHALLRVDRSQSDKILTQIRSGDLLNKPGWVRLSIHPVMTNAEVDYIMEAISLTVAHYPEWSGDYTYDRRSDNFLFRDVVEEEGVKKWFEVESW